MQFINPIEILELQGRDAVNIDVIEIKKAKRKLVADIELSENGLFEYNGLPITKSDCERVINELDDRDRREYYCYLSTNKLLNDYLVKGDERFFKEFRQESIFKLPEFIEFISPYFSIRFEKSLNHAFISKNPILIEQILRTRSLINKADLNIGFRSVSKELDRRINDLDNETQSIKDGDAQFPENHLDEYLSIVEDHFPKESLNLLPQYFQSQINKIATSINYLGLAIWNEYTDAGIPMQLVGHLLELNIESVSKPTYESNLKIYKKKFDEDRTQEENAPILKQWAHVLIECRRISELVEKKKQLPQTALSEIKKLVNVNELNALPSFADEIRNQISFSIRGLAVSSWNVHNEIKSALSFMDTAININNSEETKAKFLKDKEELRQLEVKYQHLIQCWFCQTNAPNAASNFVFTMYKETHRTWIPRRVQYSTINLTLTRCSQCKETHSKGSTNYWIAWVAGLAIGGFIGNLIDEHFIIGGIIGLILGHFAGKAIETGEAEKKGIKSLATSSLSQHPLVSDQVKAGWQFNEPTA